MRPRAIHAARPDPMPTATEKITRNTVTVSSSPPTDCFTIGGSSDSATMPTSQNQLITSEPHHSRGSARR